MEVHDSIQPSDSFSVEKAAWFRSSLLEWFNLNGRVLPWRGTQDPYKIWVSEVILQQTRVNQGWDYYTRFIDRYPTVKELAESSTEELLLMWQGLGYYNRAHNMQFTARHIVEEHNGVFPQDPRIVRGLKGIGDYTTAAICSIAYNTPLAVIDGNVYRVLSRFYGIELPIDTATGKKTFQTLADSTLVTKRPGAYNQAIMDLGAMVCTPKQPNCNNCPVAAHCVASYSPLAEQLPIKAKKTAVQERFLDFLCFVTANAIMVGQRDKMGIWKNLYQFPVKESNHCNMTDAEIREWINLVSPSKVFRIEKKKEIQHLLTHRKLHICIHVVRVYQTFPLKGFSWIPLDTHTAYAFPRPIRAFLNDNFGTAVQ